MADLGGRRQRWRSDGRELYYRAEDGTLMSASVSTATTFQYGASEPLFGAVPSRTSFDMFRYQPSSDGQRFLVTLPGEGKPISIVMNWQAELENP